MGKREIKETSNFYWKGLKKKPLDTVLLMVVTPVKYLSGHKEGPSKNDVYASTKAVNVSASGRQWSID